MLKIRDNKNEMPADFNQWLNRWALEVTGVISVDSRLGVLDAEESEEAKRIVKVGCLETLFQASILFKL